MLNWFQRPLFHVSVSGSVLDSVSTKFNADALFHVSVSTKCFFIFFLFGPHFELNILLLSLILQSFYFSFFRTLFTNMDMRILIRTTEIAPMFVNFFSFYLNMDMWIRILIPRHGIAALQLKACLKANCSLSFPMKSMRNWHYTTLY